MAFPSMKETRPQAFLLPRYYTQTKDDLPSKAGKLAPETMYETKFKGGNMSPEALARTRVMQQERREALRQSTIPLGKGGVQHKNTGVTTYR